MLKYFVGGIVKVGFYFLIVVLYWRRERLQNASGTMKRQMVEVNRMLKIHGKNYLLDQYVNLDGTSIMPSNQIPVIHILLQSSGLPMATINLLTTASSLIESGLNTHARIEDYVGQTTTRQLSVLAGDYYSGKYYKILADANMVNAIHIFAKSIQQINEAKMSRHFASFDQVSVNIYLIWLEQIYGSIALNLVEEYSLEEHLWRPICLNLALVQALTDEKLQVIPTYKSQISLKLILLYEALRPTSEEQFKQLLEDRAEVERLFAKHQIDRSLAAYIDTFLEAALSNIEKLQTKHIKDELKRYVMDTYADNKRQTIVID